ncbi:acyl carrier protein [Polaromonas sp. JS666]|uniref:acyl carrier protein n=1 Tax=Polaromonas sp. (strain JS666 / ATCC BAA-500) TaxID=296591 RepID=UPI00004646A4|nr:acyl carrier protein [Polaromonas sp. JS666]ABE47183.1 phosphopantetheine-binding [Polaromonas sp. JS666]
MNTNAFDPKGLSSEEISLEIQDWLVRHIGDLLSLPVDKVPVDAPFDRYGLDSAAAVGMIGDLGDWLGKTLEPTLPYDYPTAQQLADHLAAVIADAPVHSESPALSTT